MKKATIFAKILFSLALVYFTTSLILLTIELGKIRESVPEILVSIEKIENGKNLNNISNSMAIVSKELPNVLKEIKEVRKLTPTILKQVDKTTNTIPSILKESQEIRKSIPPILKESQNLRKEIPPELNKVEHITKNIQQISNDAASGAVTGTIGGVLSLPKNLIKKTTNILKGDTKK